MTPAKRKKFCADRGKKRKEAYDRQTPKERRANLQKAYAGIAKKAATKEGKAAIRAFALKNLEKINNPVIRDLPRINDYAGNITFSEYESL